ncbi:MAG TPA: shikimate dehydrogenase [Microbacterium sp.]|uniref:shikimate dehydrogenase n=1 Tax=Microbacterium sp. TaxID=51671 RepID=UPI002CDE6256|nr:shikimate dehydrogenase [Microbacterium sp.]HWI31716.1 shikimate dehydrogenase [Microbacterium sp.]
MLTRTALAVWGDPIEHSRSPALHHAAYRALGLDWEYGRRRVGAEEFDDALAGLDARWRGISCTMPLKERAFAASTVRDRRAEATGAVNTLLLGAAGGPRGWNTDVGGVVRTLAEEGVENVGRARIVGAGATAASAVVALHELGAGLIEVVARRPERALPLIRLGESLGVSVIVAPLDSRERENRVDVTVATLPSGTELDPDVASALAERGGVLLDAAYAPWPSTLAAAWNAHGGAALSGLGMLLHQALLQVRIFVNGDVDAVLADEADVLAAMRSALVGD